MEASGALQVNAVRASDTQSHMAGAWDVDNPYAVYMGYKSRQQMVVVGMMVLDSVQQLGCVVVVCW